MLSLHLDAFHVLDHLVPLCFVDKIQQRPIFKRSRIPRSRLAITWWESKPRDQIARGAVGSGEDASFEIRVDMLVQRYTRQNDELVWNRAQV